MQSVKNSTLKGQFRAVLLSEKSIGISWSLRTSKDTTRDALFHYSLMKNLIFIRFGSPILLVEIEARFMSTKC